LFGEYREVELKRNSVMNKNRNMNVPSVVLEEVGVSEVRLLGQGPHVCHCFVLKAILKQT
jgi:hypothetical protein